MKDYRDRSLWLNEMPGPLDPRPGLPGDDTADVAIVGGGFTGLWTAYYLKQLDPGLRVTVIEREICGFGASGRNGGWCIGELAASVPVYAAYGGHDAAVRLARAAFDAVDEVGRVAEAEGIDCRYAKGGTVYLARSQPQLDRQAEEIEEWRTAGFGSDDIRALEPDEARARVGATDVRGGMLFSHAAALDPARLVRGLADGAAALGVTIVEQTAATAIEEGRVVTNRGTVRADVVVRATEAYTPELEGERRTLVPVYSLMVATEPLADSVWDEIGMADRPTFADSRYMVIYGQRTGDNRLAFGGRGVPYAYGSKVRRELEQHRPHHDLIAETLTELFPAVGGAEITHRWGGVLAIPRNWVPSVHFDRQTGLADGGGYVGEGVAAANLAGRTLADLITGTDSERVDLPWVNVPWPRWEPEPLRWLGIRISRRLLARADNHEFRTDRTHRSATWFARLLRREP